MCRARSQLSYIVVTRSLHMWRSSKQQHSCGCMNETSSPQICDKLCFEDLFLTIYDVVLNQAFWNHVPQCFSFTHQFDATNQHMSSILCLKKKIITTAFSQQF